jgi:N-acetylglucosaminyl-diphospho-decaprenol L-rhamnosyltransferase
MKVDILIVSYRSLADVEACLSRLERSTHADYRIILRENGAGAAWTAMKAKLPRRMPGGQAIEILDRCDNVGFAGGVNACLAAGAADAYWILNPDTRPEPTALAEMVARLARGDCAMVGHDLVLPSGVLASRGGGRWKPLTALAFSIDHGKPREPRPPHAQVEDAMNYVVGASMLVSAGYVARVGLMREDYFLYCEEIEWCLKGLAAGERLGYAPGALVTHLHGGSTGAGGPMRERSKLSIYLQERNRILLTRDRFPRLLPVASLAALCHLTLRYSRAGAWRQLGYALQGWAKGMLNERGAPAWAASSPRGEVCAALPATSQGLQG